MGVVSVRTTQHSLNTPLELGIPHWLRHRLDPRQPCTLLGSQFAVDSNRARAVLDSEGHDLPPELRFEDAEDLADVSGDGPPSFRDSEANLALLDEEIAEALRDETVHTILREVVRLPERNRKIVRQFEEEDIRH